MYLIDFKYDGFLLSDFGYIVCDLDSTGKINTVSNGSLITFETTPMLKGIKHLLADTKYETCLTTKFQICKDPCLYHGDDTVMTVDDIADMTRWLNRKSFRMVRFDDVNGYEHLYFQGSFNVSTLEVNGEVIGLEIELTTNAPFALRDPIRKKYEMTTGQTVTFNDTSDEMGYLYPQTTITCKAAGTLKIFNHIEQRETIINNCSVGEVITMNYPVITSSMPEHNIADDFNYKFFRIANSWNNRLNKITVSSPCTFEFLYNPIRKIGI